MTEREMRGYEDSHLEPHDPEMTDELDCPRGCTDIGMSYALTGDTPEAMLAQLTAECGPLADWQRSALLGGYDAGQADLEAYKTDRAAEPFDTHTPDENLPW